jgi:hypothetical protein
MSDVTAIFGILLSLGIVFPGFLTAWWLLFPATVERARVRLEATPWQCFWLGGVVTAVVVIPVTILIALPIGPAQLLGWLGVAGSLTFASLGAAGLAAMMAQRLQGHSALSPAAAFVRAAVALELAAALPFIGWLVVVPLAIVVSLGAAVFALLRWQPAPVFRSAAAPIAPVAALDAHQA